jgi:myo-inositol-1(or 4)-monophosphatase
MTAVDRLNFAIDLARRAGEVGMRYFRELDSLTIESKGHQDLVSNADREVELFVRGEIAANYPQDGVVGEEHAPVEGVSGDIWVIDPIDGTANFVRGIPQWCVIIVCVREGKTHTAVIHEPASGETFWARHGGGAFCNGRQIRVSGADSIGEGSIGVGFNNRTRALNILPVCERIVQEGSMFFRNQSGGLMLAYVAAGRLLAYCEEHMNGWDCLAGMLLVEEAGGLTEPFNRGDPVVNGTVVIAGGKGVFDTVREICTGPFSL